MRFNAWKECVDMVLRGDITKSFMKVTGSEWAADHGPSFAETLETRVFFAGLEEGARNKIGHHDKGNAKADVLGAGSPREKEKQNFRRFLHGLLRQMENWSVEDHFRELNIFADWLNDKADRFEKQAGKLIEEYSPKMQANSEFISEADAILEARKNDQPIKPEDVRKLLKKRGIEVDDDVPLVVLLEKLETARSEADQENSAYANEINVLINQADEYRTQAEKIRTAEEKIKDDLKHGRITEAEAKQQLKQVWEDVPEKIRMEYGKQYGTTEQFLANEENLEAQKQMDLNNAHGAPPSKLDQNKGTLAREFGDKTNGEVSEENKEFTEPAKVAEYDPMA